MPSTSLSTCPPATSDAPLTVMQTIPMDGFVVVVTPQELAQLDGRRCIHMIRKLKLKVLGIVENYTGEMFGEGAGVSLSEELDSPFLGTISLRPDYRDTLEAYGPQLQRGDGRIPAHRRPVEGIPVQRRLLTPLVPGIVLRPWGSLIESQY